jgi:hypothetical protein
MTSVSFTRQVFISASDSIVALQINVKLLFPADFHARFREKFEWTRFQGVRIDRVPQQVKPIGLPI